MRILSVPNKSHQMHMQLLWSQSPWNHGIISTRRLYCINEKIVLVCFWFIITENYHNKWIIHPGIITRHNYPSIFSPQYEISQYSYKKCWQRVWGTQVRDTRSQLTSYYNESEQLTYHKMSLRYCGCGRLSKKAHDVWHRQSLTDTTER